MLVIKSNQSLNFLRLFLFLILFLKRISLPFGQFKKYLSNLLHAVLLSMTMQIFYFETGFLFPPK